MIEDGPTEALIGQLATMTRLDSAQAVQLAVQHELQRQEAMRRDIRELQERIASWPDSGLDADKAFYDWLSDEA